MQSLFRIFIVLILITSFSCSEGIDPGLEEEFQSAINSAIDSTARAKGLSAAVILPNGLTWTGAAGISYEGEKMTPEHMFSVGSIGKTYTAAVALQMCGEGKFSLDDQIHQYLPVYENVDSTITIRQLMNQTSGLADFADNPRYWNDIFGGPSRVWGLHEMLRDFILEPDYAPGEGWNYATTNYVLLRKMIQDISGSTMPEIYNKRIFSKFNLANTWATQDSTLPAKAVHSWLDLDNDGVYDEFTSWDRTAFVSSIGSEVWATSADLAAWTDLLVNEKSVIPDEFEDDMFDFHSPCPGEGFISGYGLAIVDFNTDMTMGIRAWGHAGNALGFGAVTVYMPDYDVTVAILDNTEKFEAIMPGFANIINVIIKNIPTAVSD